MKNQILFLFLFISTGIQAQKMIHELPAKTNVDSTNWLFLTGNPVSGKLYKITAANLRDSIAPATDTTSLSNRINLKLNATDTASLSDRIDGKQATLVSGTNIKTVNGSTLLGSGNLVIAGGDALDTTSLSLRIDAKQTDLKYFVVTDYGAVPDSSTNNYAAFQATVNAAKAAGGGVVYIPRGKWGLTQTVIVDTSNIVVMGAGAGSEVWANTDFGDIFYARPNTIPPPYANYFHDIRFQDITVKSAVARTSGFAIRTNYTHSATVSGVVVGQIRTEQNNVLPRIYKGVSFENQSNSILQNTQIYAWKYGVYFTSTQSGSDFRNTNNYDGLITGNCFILGDSTKWHRSDSTVGVYIAGGTGGIQIEQSNISFYTNGIRVDESGTGTDNRELFINHAFAADNCGGHGIYILNDLNVLQMTGMWSSSCGKAPVDINDGYSIYIDTAVSVGLKTTMAGGSILNSPNGIYLGTGVVSITGAYVQTANSIVLGPNISSASVTGGTVGSFANNSAITPKIRGVSGLDDSGGNIAKVVLDNVASGEMSSGTYIYTELDRSMILAADPADPDAEKVQIAVVTGGSYRSKFEVQNGSDNIWLLKGNLGNISVGGVTPTAKLHLPAGNNSSGTAPLKLTSGPAMDTPEDGAIEYNGTHYYATIGSTRHQLDQQAAGSNTQIQFNNSGSFGGSANLTWDGSRVQTPGIGVGSGTSATWPFDLKADGTQISGNFYSNFRAVNATPDRGFYFGYDNTQAGSGIIAANSNYLAFWTYNGSAWGERLRIAPSGILKIANAPVYADDAAAGTGGLTTGDVFQTSAGVLMIKQ